MLLWTLGPSQGQVTKAQTGRNAPHGDEKGEGGGASKAEPRGHPCTVQLAAGDRPPGPAICFKMLRDIDSSDPLHLKYIIKKIKDMAQVSPYLVMETIHDYFADNPEISNRHKFRLFQVLKNVIGASDVMEDIWKRRFMQLALENMTKSMELEDMYQNAASDVLVALCRHSWPEVAQHLETEFLTGVFPHRSVLYVMGTLSSHEELLNREDRARWENLLAQVAAKSVPFLNTDMWSRELLSALTKPSRTQQEELPEKVGPAPGSPHPTPHTHCPQDTQVLEGNWWTQRKRTFLFTFYGMVLQAEEESTTVRAHLQSLLETSHQWSKQRESGQLGTRCPRISAESPHPVPVSGLGVGPGPAYNIGSPTQGIALTVGLAASRHLNDVWAILDQFGRSGPIKWSLHSFSLKVPARASAQGWSWASILHKDQSLRAGTSGARQGQEHGLWVTQPDSSPTCSMAPCASASS
ncbi:Hypothetical predicted protein [Marmota monax]|uniref:MROH2B-like N-terminal HEAT-repeats domain-containing protein n=1 Tax=Marmota monax TaxID=9995 RepID=A0A5E4B5L0_MARMO|nr:Hypothetical predicted protein [Marmota monax]